uniref:hypothetical protein n=1 Tax=Bradyrhizobium sp. WSM1743 TaxID=318996 RepID=UPI001AEBBE76
CCDSGDKISCDFAGHLMKRFVEGVDRGQSTLLSARLAQAVAARAGQRRCRDSANTTSVIDAGGRLMGRRQ